MHRGRHHRRAARRDLRPDRLAEHPQRHARSIGRYVAWHREPGGGHVVRAELVVSVQRQETEQIAGPIVQHVIFGVATAATYQWLHDLT
jgi:hypothetical protein